MSLSIDPGEFVVIAGRNGGGKTTLINLIAGLYAPQEGQVRANGVDISLFKADEWLPILGMLSQEFHLVTGITIRENIEFGHIGDRPSLSFEQAAHMAESRCVR